ncbi:MAG TPA: hypothetical protein EYP86_04190, partial [Candidatus Altiarchaeales archaeon]|nr:hypothetical protein [Candidatus Altiarchaeales archaeon]
MLTQYEVEELEFEPSDKRLLDSIENKFLTKFSAIIPHMSREERNERMRKLLEDETLTIGL